MVVTLSSVYEVIRTNMTPSYEHQQYHPIVRIYSWNNSVVIILGGRDGHGHDNKFNKEVDNPQSSSSNIPTIIIVSSYVPTQSYITINDSRRRREAKSAGTC